MPDGARGRLETGGFDFVRTVLSDDLLVLPYAWFEYFYVFKGVSCKDAEFDKPKVSRVGRLII